MRGGGEVGGERGGNEGAVCGFLLLKEELFEAVVVGSWGSI